MPRDDRITRVDSGPMFASPRVVEAGGGARFHTLVIASSTSTAASRATADYIIDVNTNAAEVVQVAVDRIVAESTFGGTLRFTEGLFRFLGPPVFLPSSGLVSLAFIGAGAGATRWEFTAPAFDGSVNDNPYLIMWLGNGHYRFEGLHVSGVFPDPGTTSSHRLRLFNHGYPYATQTNWVRSVTIDHCMFDLSASPAGHFLTLEVWYNISDPLTQRATITNSSFHGCTHVDGSVIEVWNGLATLSNVYVHDTTLEARGTRGYVNGLVAEGGSVVIGGGMFLTGSAIRSWRTRPLAIVGPGRARGNRITVTNHANRPAGEWTPVWLMDPRIRIEDNVVVTDMPVGYLFELDSTTPSQNKMVITRNDFRGASFDFVAQYATAETVITKNLMPAVV